MRNFSRRVAVHKTQRGGGRYSVELEGHYLGTVCRNDLVPDGVVGRWWIVGGGGFCTRTEAVRHLVRQAESDPNSEHHKE